MWLLLYLEHVRLGHCLNTKSSKNIFEIPFWFLSFQKYMIIMIVTVASDIPKLDPTAIQVLSTMAFGLIEFFWVLSETKAYDNKQ